MRTHTSDAVDGYQWFDELQAVQMNDAYRMRTRNALTETRLALAKELGYMPHLRHEKMVAFYRGHIEKLETMLGNVPCECCSTGSCK
jgi:hypothetical protein